MDINRACKSQNAQDIILIHVLLARSPAAELAVLKSAMSIQELQEQIVARQKELEDVDAKLDKHRASQEEVVSLDDLEATEKVPSMEHILSRFYRIPSYSCCDLECTVRADRDKRCPNMGKPSKNIPEHLGHRW